MIYCVAAFCTVRLRRREPDAPRHFSVRALRVLGPLGIVVFGVLAVIASLSVNNHFNPAPLVIIAIGAGLSAFYVLRVLPGVRAREAARRAAQPRRRPPRPTA
jgi:amino acid transporter